MVACGIAAGVGAMLRLLFTSALVAAGDGVWSFTPWTHPVALPEGRPRASQSARLQALGYTGLGTRALKGVRS